VLAPTDCEFNTVVENDRRLQDIVDAQAELRREHGVSGALDPAAGCTDIGGVSTDAGAVLIITVFVKISKRLAGGGRDGVLPVAVTAGGDEVLVSRKSLHVMRPHSKGILGGRASGIIVTSCRCGMPHRQRSAEPGQGKI